MLSIPDMAILGAAALIFFGPDQLPKVARKVGLFMREAQNTSQQFIREIERAGEDPAPAWKPETSDYSWTPPPPRSYEPPWAREEPVAVPEPAPYVPPQPVTVAPWARDLPPEGH